MLDGEGGLLRRRRIGALSTDGITWTLGTLTGAAAVNSVAFGNGKFVAVGGSTAWTSADGITFTSGAIGVGSMNEVRFINSQFVAVGVNRIATSPWVQVIGPVINSTPTGLTMGLISPAPTTNNLLSIAYGGGRFVAVGEKGTVVTSTTGGIGHLVP